MIFTHLDDLATNLRDDKLTEADKFEYLVLLVVLSGLSGSTVVFNPWRSAAQPWLLVSTVAFFLIGLTVCVRLNQRGDNRAFLERVIVLGAAISLRLTLVTHAVWYGAMALKVGPGATIAEWTQAQTFTVLAVIQLSAYGIGFAWLYTTLEIASGGPIRTSAVIKPARPRARASTNTMS